jgi:protein-disulfide isomerase
MGFRWDLLGAGALVLAACEPEPSCEHGSAWAVEQPATGHAVARWEGGEVTLTELERELRTELRDLEVQYQLERYELLHRALDHDVKQTLLERARVKAGKASVEELFEVEVHAKVAQPSEEEITAELERSLLHMPDADLALLRPHVVEQLLARNLELRREAYLEELRAEAGLVIDFPYPPVERIAVTVDADDPVLGATDAPVTIVEFAEYQCYFCARVAPSLQKLVDAHPGKVRIVFKDFPHPSHEGALRAAVAARCAGRQGHYWELSRILLDNPGRQQHDQIRRSVEALGLDVDGWEACMREPGWLDRVGADIHAGRQAGVSSTPTFFVNGLMLTGAQPYERFAALVEQELANQAATSAPR